MEIILIRHGIAKEKRADLEDIKRHLTEKGKKKFRELMSEFKEELEPIEKQTLQLWSSPANRALETAEIVAEALEIEMDAVHDFIYEGEFEKFHTEVQTVDDDAQLMIVGHEPTLSEWAERMMGEELKIKKGEILDFKVTDRNTLKAELQWRVKPK